MATLTGVYIVIRTSRAPYPSKYRAARVLAFIVMFGQMSPLGLRYIRGQVALPIQNMS